MALVDRLFNREGLTGCDRLACYRAYLNYWFEVPPVYTGNWDAVSWTNSIFFGSQAATRCAYGHVYLMEDAPLVGFCEACGGDVVPEEDWKLRHGSLYHTGCLEEA